jgi:hypothetical protein
MSQHPLVQVARIKTTVCNAHVLRLTEAASLIGKGTGDGYNREATVTTRPGVDYGSSTASERSNARASVEKLL